jgi:hypothetical protein
MARALRKIRGDRVADLSLRTTIAPGRQLTPLGSVELVDDELLR